MSTKKSIPLIELLLIDEMAVRKRFPHGAWCSSAEIHRSRKAGTLLPLTRAIPARVSLAARPKNESLQFSLLQLDNAS